jgi:hypothetical protein
MNAEYKRKKRIATSNVAGWCRTTAVKEIGMRKFPMIAEESK